MESGKIVYTGTSKSDKPLVIRYPTMDDAKAMSEYINTLSEEQTYITFQGEHMSEEDEQKYLEKELQSIKELRAVFLLVLCEGRLIGISGIDLGVRTSSHVGMFGISIAKTFRGDGIGSILMETIHEEAERQLSDLKIVYLGLFANNDLARQMYEHFGYKEYGRLPEGIYYKGTYIDHIYMYKKIR